MGKVFVCLFVIIGTHISLAQELIITGVFDGPLDRGTPKAIELFAFQDIEDLSLYGIGSANNGDGSDGIEFQLSGSASKATFIYIATETNNFKNYFGFEPNYVSNVANINGNDAIELFSDLSPNSKNTTSGVVIDVFGDIKGSSEQWNYLDGWAYRKPNILPNQGSFDTNNWIFSGPNANDNTITNTTSTIPWPIKSYSFSENLLSNGENSITKNSFRIYPNPSYDGSVIINFNTKSNYTLSVFDVLGHKILSETLVTDIYPIDHLSSGIYLVRIKTEQNSFTKKLIVR